MIFICDAWYLGRDNDPAEQAGVVSIPVKDHRETKLVNQAIIACFSRLRSERVTLGVG